MRACAEGDNPHTMLSRDYKNLTIFFPLSAYYSPARPRMVSRDFTFCPYKVAISRYHFYTETIMGVARFTSEVHTQARFDARLIVNHSYPFRLFCACLLFLHTYC